MALIHQFMKRVFAPKRNMATALQDLTVHPQTEDPESAWEMLKGDQVFIAVEPLPKKTPIHPNKVRFVCISDTHNRTDDRLRAAIPDGDVLLHTGDFTMQGRPIEVNMFNQFLGALPHKYKIVIAGNHELSFDKPHLEDDDVEHLEQRGLTCTRELLTNCTYLQDSQTSVYGIRIYGSPWQPVYCGWAFNLERGEPLLAKWKNIPTDTDVLMTHGPPIGRRDFAKNECRAGCVELLNTVQQRVKPKYHVFGHIHEDYGMTSDGVTTFINASTCNRNYKAVNPPVIFDLPLPRGQRKDIPMPEVFPPTLSQADITPLSTVAFCGRT